MNSSKRAITSKTLSWSNNPLKSEAIFTALLVTSFLLLGLAGILNHELWRDEFQAWMIARDSSSIQDLFHNLRYEGHPGLWHLGLYFLSRIDRHPILMQAFHLAIATGSVFLFVRFSPFNQLHKILFIFGYFPFYEYAVISRSYALGVLLIFLFCTVYLFNRKGNKIISSIILALLANTSAYGLVIAGSLYSLLVFESISNEELASAKVKRELLISLLIVCLGVGLTVWQMLPPGDGEVTLGVQDKLDTTSTSLSSSIKDALFTIADFWRSYIPVPKIFDYQFWNTSIMDYLPDIVSRRLRFLISLLLFLFSVGWFLKQRLLLLCYLLGVVGILILNYFNFNLSIRHSGHLFILFIAYLWILLDQKASIANSRLVQRRSSLSARKRTTVLTTTFTVILCLHLFSGVYSFSRDLVNPFSRSKEAASFIESNSLNQLMIVANEKASGLSGWLDKKIYYLENNQFGSYLVWKNIKQVKTQSIFHQASKLLTTDNPEILLISSRNLTGYENPPGVIVKHLVSFDKSLVFDEQFYLYLLQYPGGIETQPNG